MELLATNVCLKLTNNVSDMQDPRMLVRILSLFIQLARANIQNPIVPEKNRIFKHWQMLVWDWSQLKLNMMLVLGIY